MERSVLAKEAAADGHGYKVEPRSGNRWKRVWTGYASQRALSIVAARIDGSLLRPRGLHRANPGRIFIVYTRRQAMKIEFAEWGNSLAVRIPAALAQEVGAREGKPAEITVENGALILKPIARQKKRRRYTLEELVAGITPENRHPETDWGPARGKEAW